MLFMWSHLHFIKIDYLIFQKTTIANLILIFFRNIYTIAGILQLST